MHGAGSIALFYAAYFAGLGIMLPYFPLYLASLGANASQVGFLVGLLASAKVIAPPLIGWIVDAATEKRRFIAGFMLLAAIGMLAIGSGAAWPILAVLVFAFGFVWSAALPLTDSLSIAVAERWRLDYGRMRVWGSVGFVLATLAGGLLLSGARMAWLPALMSLLLLFGYVAARRFPSSSGLAMEETEDGRFSPSLKRLLAAGFIMQASHGAYYGFYSLYLQAHAFAPFAIGLLWVLGVLAEIALMWRWSGRIGRASPRHVVGLCLWIAAVRWFGIGAFPSVWILAPLQLLHAATFAAFHVHAVAWIGRWASKGRQAYAQGWYAASGFGLGTTLGIMACGWIIDHAGFRAAFFACAVLAAAGSSIALGLPRHGWGAANKLG